MLEYIITDSEISTRIAVKIKTVNSPEFPEMWAEICGYLNDIPVLVAHNAALTSVAPVIHWSYMVWRIQTLLYCSLRAPCRLYNFGCNSLDYLYDQFKIPYGQHHRAGDNAEMCAQLFLRELKDFGLCRLEEMKYYGGKL